MATVGNILSRLFELAPAEAKMDFDNIGLLAGGARARVNGIIVALDITSEVIEEAVETGANLIVSHHPLLFELKRITDADVRGKKLLTMLSHGISAICMHTNLDAARGGVNDALAKAAGLGSVELLSEDGRYSDGTPFSYGRIGVLENPTGMRDYMTFLKSALKTHGLRYHNSGRRVSRVAVVGGSGGDYLRAAFEHGCDTLVTSDVKYDVFLDARELGINLIDADHFCTENVVTPELRRVISETFPTISCKTSTKHGQTARFFV
ncbi:MAG: Nif3-like dinuclear metal center hexameric protein [Oscillospiraceae bacterium]|jgi:dinuclear metal center YbgI/SA1388 family protein|nr:Nif3-like dinuclear metal center hexameric protein [Oscillospiraceae bacterium]